MPPAGARSLEILEPRLLLDADLIATQPFSCLGIALDEEAVVVDLNRESADSRESDSCVIATFPASSGPASLTEPPDAGSQSATSDLGPAGQDDATGSVLSTPFYQVESSSQAQIEPGISTALCGHESTGSTAGGQRDSLSVSEALPLEARGPPSSGLSRLNAVSIGRDEASSESSGLASSPVTHTDVYAGVDVEVSTAPEVSRFALLGLPASYDLRSFGDVTPAKNQGNAGACWIFSTYGSLESTILVNSGIATDLSENHMKNYNGFDLGPTRGGNAFMAQAYLSRWDGPVSEADDPYHDYDDRPSPGGPPQYYVRDVLEFDTPDELKNGLMTYGAISVSMFYDLVGPSYNAASNTYYYSGAASSNHGVTLVGWDDTLAVPNAPGPGAWLVKNSWGDSWGQGGYFWISYYDSRGAKDGFCFCDAVAPNTYQKVYYHDTLGFIGSLSCSYAFNAFTATSDQGLTAVQFWTKVDGAGYDVRIYDTFTEDGALADLITSTAGTLRYAGCHTVDLPTPVHLTAGNDFYVYLHLTDSGSFPMAADWAVPGFSSTCTANPGEGYFSGDGTRWTDLTEFIPTASFSIKALVTITNPGEIAASGNGVPIPDGNTIISPEDGTLFGTVTQGDAPISRTFTVRNDGGGTLVLGTVTVPAGFTVTEGLPTTLAPGESDTFTVRLDTTAGGTKRGDITIPNDDPDEHPFNFRIVGTVMGPRLVVDWAGGFQVADGDTTPTRGDGTDFGIAAWQGSPLTQTFVVHNYGNAPLILGPVVAPTGFTVTEGLSGSLEPNHSDAFTVQLDTAVAGAKTGEISFSNSDFDENPFNFAIIGVVTDQAEITVLGNGIVIADADVTPQTADGTNFGSVMVGGAPVSHTFTVRNDGAAPLHLGAMTVPTGFTVTEGLPATLAPGASDTFTVRLETATAGVKSGDISLPNDEADAGDGLENPFNFQIIGRVTTSEEPIVFVDPKLKLVVEAALGVANPTPTDMLALTSLDGAGEEIRNLEGLQFASNLVWLDLWANPIPDISPLAQLAKLTYLKVSNNWLSSLPSMAAMTSLTTLNIAANGIRSLAGLAGVTSLTWLDAGDQAIDDISALAGLTNLTYLSLHNCPGFPSVSPLSTLTNLTYLELEKDGVSDISPLAGLTNLTYLNLHMNQVGDISALSGMLHLTRLYLSWNFHVSDLSPLSNLTDLVDLSLQNNAITDLAPLAGLTNLTTLDLYGNGITDLSPLSHLTNLTWLSLGYNVTLTDISPLSVLTNLTYLNFVKDPVSSLVPLAPLTNLTYLNVAPDGVIDLSPLAGMTRTQELHLGGDFRDISPLAGMTAMTILEVGGHLTDISALSHMVNLTYLQLGLLSPIDISPLAGLTNLEELHLGSSLFCAGLIEDISALSGLTNLTKLYVTNHLVDDITPIAGLTKLTELGLNDNCVRDLAPLVTLTRLVYLSVCGNPLNPEAYAMYFPLIAANNPGMAAPCYDPPSSAEVTVLGNGIFISDGDSAPNTAMGTDFGTIMRGSAPVVHTFVIRNDGTELLTLRRNRVAAPEGFSWGGLWNSIAPGASDTFTVTLDTNVSGVKTGEFLLGCSDQDENTFRFRVTGTVFGGDPEITVLGNGISINDGDTTPSTADGTDFGTIMRGSGPISHTFIVCNDGTSVLTFSMAWSGMPAGFSTGWWQSGALVPGASEAFTVELSTAVSGTFTGDISFTNNDPDEQPFHFRVAGTVFGGDPDITVLGNGISIAYGDTTPSTADGTDFGMVMRGSDTVTHTFTVRNDGTSLLTFSMAWSGMPAGFSTGWWQSGTLAPGASSTFTVELSTAGSGTFTGDISFTNNDPEEQPFRFCVTGTIFGGDPDITVLGNGILIGDGDTTPSIADGTDFGTVAQGSASVTHTFTVRNDGTSLLTFSMAWSGVPAGFGTAWWQSGALAPGASGTFTVELSTAAAGTYTGDISFTNNDPDEGPFNFTITGVVASAGVPDITVQGNGVSIVDGDTTPSPSDGTDFDVVLRDSVPFGHTFTVRNDGVGALLLAPVIVPAGFTLTKDLPASLGPGGSDAFTVQLDTAATGTKRGEILLANSDADEDPFTFQITGVVTLDGSPEIAVSGNGISIANGDATPSTADGTDFGTVLRGSTPVSRTFVIRNDGGSVLTFGPPSTVPAGFTWTAGSDASLAAGEVSSFTVRLETTALGIKAGDFAFATNDPDENPFHFALMGTVVGDPDITVLGNGISIGNNDTTPSVADGTDFGTIMRGGTPIIRTFTVHNDGTAFLTFDTSQCGVPNGFRWSGLSNPLAPGGSGTLTIQLDTDASGAKTGNVSLLTNDPDESPFHFALTGTVVGEPDVTVLGNGISISNNSTTPSVVEGTDFGTVIRGSTPISHKFTVRNDGTAILNLDTFWSGVPEGFRWSGLPSRLAPGESGTLTIQLDTDISGVKTGNVSVLTNDTNENPFRFRVTGTVFGGDPEIAILSNGLSITSGDATPSVTDGTDFGTVLRGSSMPVSRTFTVSNEGTAFLTYDMVWSRVPDGFRLGGASLNLAPGQTGTLTIQLDTDVSGIKTGDVSLSTNDPDENPFRFRITGTVLEPTPEITVLGNGISVTDGDTTPSAADGTDFGSVVRYDVPILHRFMVRNDGAASLTLGAASVPTGFALADDLPSSLVPGASDTFTVRLDTAMAGTKAGEVSFATNDADENPFCFVIFGTVSESSSPEVTVLGNGSALVAGDATPTVADDTDFGLVGQGGAASSHTFTVRNDGTATLTLGAVTVPSGYTLTEALSASLAPGTSDTFTVQLDTVAGGTKAGDISFTSNDADENPFHFAVTAVVLTTPEITVLGNGVSISNGSATANTADGTDYGAPVQGGTVVSHTFTVRNDGGAPLTLGTVTVPAGYTLTKALAGSLAAGASDTFTVQLETTTAGTKMGEISFANDDAEGGDGVENPFHFAITGTVLTPPEVTMLGNGISISDEDTTPSTMDGTDFGSATQGGGANSRTFAVRNDGSSSLTSAAVTVPTGYTLTRAPAGSLAAGVSDMFTVRLDTTTPGIKTGEISFINSCAEVGEGEENSFHFAITGTVLAPPEITVLGNSVSIADGDTTPSTADDTDFGSVRQGTAGISRTFTVRNEGQLPLTLGAVTVPTGFTLTEGLSPSLAAGESDTLTVQLDTATCGIKTGDISFSTNDADESPFNFQIRGIVTTDEGLDPSFSGDGRQTTAVGSFDDCAYSVALQPDGKIVVASSSFNGTNYDFAVARYNPDGSLDSMFSGDGIQTTAIGSSADFGNSVAIQPDGKIVVAGYAYTGRNDDFAVARYNSNGTPDTSFSGDGKLTTPIGTSDDQAYSVAVQPDGKIVVAGYSKVGGNWDFAVARYLSDGMPDPSFSGDGKLTTAIGSGDDCASSMVLQPDGKIVVAGTSFNGGNADFAVARYLPDGAADLSFSGDGKALTPIGTSNDYAYSVVLQPDGRILVAGYSDDGETSDFAVVRYNADGSLDTAFSGDGIQTTPIGSSRDWGYSAVLQSDGKIVVVGSSYQGGNLDFALARYNSDGTLDTSFSGDGKLTTPIGSADDFAYSAVVQPDDRIVVAGYSVRGGNYDIALVRYVAMDTTAPAAPVITRVADDTGTPDDGITSDNRLVISGTAEANSTVQLYEDSLPIGTTSANGSGNWSFDYTGTTLADGTYSLTATATDAAGNTSAPSAPLTITVDTAAPAAPAITGFADDTGAAGDGITSDTTLVLSGSAETGSTVTVCQNGASIGTAPANASGAWSFLTATLVDATYSFTATATDAAGNTSVSSGAFTVIVDTAPEVTVLGRDVPIVDGDATPSTTDGTDFGSVAQWAFAISHTFTVRNDGATVLALGAVTVPAGYTLTEGLSPSLASGASDTFTVQLDTALAGTKAGDVSFSTNDPDENPFNFRIAGTVVAGGNLASGRPAAASTSYTGLPAANATDGNVGSRWSSQFSNNEWIYVDLGSTYTINRVVLRWEAAYGRGYKLQVSGNASTWSDLYSTTTGDGGVDDISLASPGSGRYVRMLGTQRATTFGYSLYEFEVYGGPAVNHAPVVNSFGKTVMQDTPLPFTAADFTGAFTDPDAGDSLQKVKVISLPSHGVLTLNGIVVTASQEVPVAQIGALVYTPTSGYTGSDGLQWNGSDGSLYAASAAMVNLTVNSAAADLALGKTAVASSTYTGFPASNVTDGNASSRWSSQFSSNQWIYVDLGSVYTINRVVLRWEAAYARGYQLQVSSDAFSWSDVYSTTTGDGGVDDVTLSTPRTGRYVRMLGTQRATTYGYSLYELEAYGGPPANLALTKPTVASTSYTGFPAANATDGNASTRWSSQFSDSQWLYVDLGSTFSISRVVLRWEAAYGRGYKLQVSGDASTWSEVYNTTTGDGGVDDVTLGTPALGRYLRMLGTQRATTYGYSLYELEVYGAPVANLALTKPAVASTSYTGMPASNVTDGNTSTRWSSQFSDSQWLYVDLGSVYTIKQVVLRWETAYGRGYKLQVSNDASSWSDVYGTTTGDGGVDDITLAAPASGRYVRLLGTQRGSTYGYSLWEFEVYG